MGRVPRTPVSGVDVRCRMSVTDVRYGLMLLAIHRSGSPIGNHFQHRTMETWFMTEEYIMPKTITIYGASIYYSVCPKYCIIAFIGACIYKLSVIGNVIQSVLSL